VVKSGREGLGAEPMGVTLLRDADWAVTEGYPCRVIDFTPMAKIEDGEVISIKSAPYAAVILECDKIPGSVTGFICHKMDFQHLWAAFNERGVRQDEEVIIFWRKMDLNWLSKLLSFIMPRFVVWICRKGAYELSNPDCQPELQGEARLEAERPIVEWKPRVME